MDKENGVKSLVLFYTINYSHYSIAICVLGHEWRFFCAISCKNEKNVVPLQCKVAWKSVKIAQKVAWKSVKIAPKVIWKSVIICCKS